MTKSELLSVVIKIFGLYYFVRFIQHFMEFIFMLVGNSAFDYGIDTWFIYSGIFITVVVEFFFSYVATLRTELITNRIGKLGNEPFELPTNKTSLLEITLAAIGIITIVSSIPDLLYKAVDAIYFHNHKESEFWTRPTRSEVFRAAFILVIGCFLLMNSRNFAKKIVKRGELDDDFDEKGER